MFYKAVREGALSTGKEVYDLGVVPIPCIPYMLAHWDCDSNPVPISLVLYKTASHNPASQDGLKVFVKKSHWKTYFSYSKAPVELEFAIAALLHREAVGKSIKKEIKGGCQIMEKIAFEVLAQIMFHNLPMSNGVGFMAVDLAHGAFAWPSYQEALKGVIAKAGINNFVFVGNCPDGKNINSNEGEDRVGASHFENVYEIPSQELSPGGKFYGFPALKLLWEYSETHVGELQDGNTAWAIFTDGDGDRSYAAFYNPFTKSFSVIDGDKAFFYEIVKAAAQKELKPGSLLAVTVESSVPFIRAVLEYLQQFYPVQLILSQDTLIAPDKINLQITPVGDKYILQHECLGAESSGHLIKPYRVVANDLKTVHEVWVGNGIMTALGTVAAMTSALGEKYIKGIAEGIWEQRLRNLASPYPSPVNHIAYIAFVRRDLWYRNSPLWQFLEDKIKEYCRPHILKRVDFEEEPDTLYFVCLENTLLFTILARLSGTENKFGIKFLTTEEMSDFSCEIIERLFREIAPLMKDHNSKACRDELKILRFLQEQVKPVRLEKIKCYLFVLQSESKDPSEQAYLMTIVESLSSKSQNLVFYDGNTLSLTERGLAFLLVTKELYERRK
jgi:phosphomannomutase